MRREAPDQRAQPVGPACADALHRGPVIPLGLLPQGVEQGRMGLRRQGLVKVFGAHGGLLASMNEGVNGL
jgi:hypothetical protein